MILLSGLPFIITNFLPARWASAPILLRVHATPRRDFHFPDHLRQVIPFHFDHSLWSVSRVMLLDFSQQFPTHFVPPWNLFLAFINRCFPDLVSERPITPGSVPFSK